MLKTSTIRKTLGVNIKYYRYLIGYTQEQLAEECNLSPRYISDIENSQGNISVDTLENIAIVLKVDPYFLLKPQEHPNLKKRVNMK